MGSENSRYGIARLLSRLALCGFVFRPSFRSAATAGGRVSRLASWRATRNAVQGLALTPQSPPAVPCERSKEGGKTAEGQVQDEQPRSPEREDSPVSGGSPGGCGGDQPSGAGRSDQAAYLQERQRSAEP